MTIHTVSTVVPTFRSALERVLQDFRTALRSLAKYPVAATVAILSLAGGIGSTAIMLMVRDAVFLKPPPMYERPDELSTVEIARPERPRGSAQAALYIRWAESQEFRSTIAAAAGGSSTDVRTEQRLQTVDVRAVTPELFAVLGVRPAMGRTFSSSPDEAESTVVLSHRIWQTLFDGRSDVIGQPVWIGDETHTVIGVMPERFWFASMQPAIWTPLDPRTLAPDTGLRVVVRRPAELSPAALAERLQRDVMAYANQLPESQRQMRVQLRKVGGTPTAEQMALVIPWILATAVLLTLLIACANAAILIFAQWTAREHEISLRASLGASRSRIVRLLLTESVLVAMLGGFLGVCATFALRRLILHNSGPAIALYDLSIDPILLANSAAVTLLAGIVAGVGPALIETRRLQGNPLRGMTSERVRQRWRNALVVVEITVTVALLVVAAALLDGYRRHFSMDLGFSTHPLLTARVENQAGVPIENTLNVIRRLPGVDRVAAASTAPLAGVGPLQVVSTDAAGSNPVSAERVLVGAQFFETLGVSLRAGRFFTSAEAVPNVAVTIINETLARRLFPRGDAIGARIWIDGKTHEIVGVVADHATVSIRRFRPGVYLPLPLQSSDARRIQFLIRATDNPAPIVPVVRREIAATSPGSRVTSAYALDEIIAVGGQEILVTTYPLFPLIGMGLFLTAAGVYGVLAFAITRRSSELAVRSAIGATGFDLLRLVTAQSLRLIAVGSALAVAVTFGLTRLVRAGGGGGSVFDTPSWHAFAIPVLIVVIVGGLATWIPSRRVLNINAARLLRAE